ncbi:MAG: phosphonopyruvate decarboxylase [Myxococcota bacterium]
MLAAEFVAALTEHGYGHFTGVPCSFFQSVYSYFQEQRPNDYTPAANEGVAVAIAAGAVMAGLPTAVLIQNSGLGNMVNPLTSLCHTYRVPVLLFVSGRAVGVKDEPQHELMGSVTEAVLESCAAKVWTMAVDAKEFGAQLAEANASMKERGLPAAFIARKGSIDTFKTKPEFEASPALSRPAVLRMTSEIIPSDAVTLATTGKQARELFAIDDQARNFYCMGSMGHVAGIGLGVAIAQPKRKVVVLDGDGSAIMHLGSMSTVGGTKPANLVHVVVDNRTYESTGNQLTTSPNTDFCSVAKACGYAQVWEADTEAAYADVLRQALAAGGPSCIHARVNLDVVKDVPRITTKHTAPEIGANFTGFLARPAGD